MNRGPRLRARFAFVMLVLASGCSRHGGNSEGGGADPAAGAWVEVRVATVAARSFASSVTAPGQWRSSGELVISAPFAGVIQDLAPHVGDHVGEGQALGTMVTRESWSALRGAELMQREARDDAARAEANHALELARRDMVRVPLVAPRAGVVLRRTLEPGAQVAESGEILALVPARNIVFEAHVPAADGARVRPGQPATVTDQGHAPRAASVQRLLPMANSADQSIMVWLAPGRTGDMAPLDHYGTARIIVGAPHRGAAVPDSAIVEDDLTGTRQVAVVNPDGRIAWTTIEPGSAEDGWHEVLRPVLAPGTRVVIEGQRGLPDSTRVKWTP